MAGIIDYIFPRRCPVCGEVTDKPGALICRSCVGHFSYVKEPSCLVCGKETGDGERDLCYDCRAYGKPFVRNIALYNYDETARASMSAFKYKGRREYADYYVQDLMERKGDLLRSFGAGLIIPVPVHKDRLYKRGYNQAAELGRRLSRQLGVPIREDLLIRNKATEAQKTLGSSQRGRNLSAAFSCRYDLSDYGKVLLVDDIYTTGSTLSACSRVLLECGVRSVYAVTICIGRDS